MKSSFFHTMVFVLLFTQSIIFAEPAKDLPKTPAIKVQVLEKVQGALIEVKGPYNVYDPKSGRKLDMAFQPSSYYMYPTSDGIKWGQEFPGVYQLLIVPDAPDVTTVVGGREYQGVIAAYQFDGFLGIVNEVSIDDFTASILSAKLRQETLSEEMLAAIAIACRTDAAFHAVYGTKEYWDVQAGQFNYEGYGVVRQDIPFTRAMKSTKGMVLVKETSRGKGVFQVDWLEKNNQLPFDAIWEVYEEGDDAKALLAKLFPETQIVLIDDVSKELRLY